MFRSRTNQSSARQKDQRGFTIVEAAVVILIIALIAAFVVPQVVVYMRRYRLGIASHNVATALQRARFLATSNNTRAGISVPEIRRVDIEQYDPEGKAEPQNKGGVQMPEGITISPDAPKQISFDGRGVVTPMPRESAKIRINGANGFYQFVMVSPTGQVTVSDTQQDQTS
jgi:prepilin-type N-terminal cleavage/methylation domain-containing protein